MDLLSAFLLQFFISTQLQDGLALGMIDFQCHPAMSFAYGFYSKGLTEGTNSRLTHRHTLKNVMYAPYVRKSGLRVLVNGAIAAEVAMTKKQARRLIVRQLDYVNQFAEENPDDFVVAKSSKEVRHYLGTTNKIIIVHSIEGAKKLLNTEEDYEFWREQGIAFFTLIHLQDDEFGGSALNRDVSPFFLNPRGLLKKTFRPKKKRGLTEKGRAAILRLADHGIMTDLTHMSPDTKNDSLDVMEKEGLAPLITHGKYRPLRKGDRGVSKEQVLRIYRLGGLFSLPINGGALGFVDPDPDIVIPDDLCRDSLDIYRFTAQTVHDYIISKSAEITGEDQGTDYDAMDEEAKIALAIGWQSDFNGFTSHSRPRYGKKGCFPESDIAGTPLPIDTKGVVNPSDLPDYFNRLSDQGLKLEPFHYSLEKFLRMWESVEERAHDGI